jgi:cytochrome b6-f complex iron-sulfur subunit
VSDLSATETRASAARPTPSTVTKPAPAPAEPKPEEVDTTRRRLVWGGIVGYLAVNFLMFLRFFFPRVLFEPPTVFNIGYPSDFALGVDTRFQQAYRIWVVKTPAQLFVVYARCTHLGCTPDWKPADHIFKCPCHGSEYDSEAINFAGPAPRPMDRCHIEKNAQGQIIVDAGRLYSWPKGQPSQFDSPNAFIQV